MLGRVQRAVDAVLGSSLQEQGLLLDGPRNRVVLADAEWALAQSILHQARSRHTLDTTPAVGERSERAAERARAALEAKAADRARTPHFRRCSRLGNWLGRSPPLRPGSALTSAELSADRSRDRGGQGEGAGAGAAGAQELGALLGLGRAHLGCGGGPP